MIPRLMIGKKTKTKTTGQAMVEFSLTILLLIVLLLGVIEFGRMLQVWITLQWSAQAGARYAATGQDSVDPAIDAWDTVRLAAIKDEVRDRSSSLSIRNVAHDSPGYYHIAVYASDPPVAGFEYPGGPNARVIVDVIYNHELITPFLHGLIPYVRLTAHAEKINERFRHPGYGTPPGLLPPTIVTPTPTPTPTPTHTPTPTETQT